MRLIARQFVNTDIFDGDEFIFPQSDRSIVEVVDEIFEKFPNAAALGVNIFTYGSNYQDKADLRREYWKDLRAVHPSTIRQ